MLKKLTLLSLISVSLFAEITLQEINSKPPSRAKNFLIWQYFKQDITPSQADKAYEQILGYHFKLNRAYLKKSNNKELLYKIACKKRVDLLEIEDKKCFNFALSSYKTLKMTNKQRVELTKRVTEKWRLDLLKIQSEKHTQQAYEKYDADTILRMFLTTGSAYRKKYLNISLDKAFMSKLSKSKKMYQFIKIVTRDANLNKLQESLFFLNAKDIGSDSNFLLALHSLKHQKKVKAFEYFKEAYEKSSKRLHKDKNLFWMYQVSNNERYLHSLLLSMNINVYTLYAHEKLNESVINYFTSLEVKNEFSAKNIQDPFSWNEILKEISLVPKDKLFELSKSYQQKNMMPVQSYLLEKAYGFKMHGYIMPYDQYLLGLSVDEKALVYSIMRQESNYIPAALSRSFALGLMQLMPFLVDDIAKKAKENVEYKEMFTPEKNIEYSLKHLEWMRKSLSHPLYMAYAYNGGLGFLKRHLKTGAFRDGEYEPYLSMELMANSQSREYAKRVVANYVMYKQILGEKISIVNLLDRAVQRKKSSLSL